MSAQWCRFRAYQISLFNGARDTLFIDYSFFFSYDFFFQFTPFIIYTFGRVYFVSLGTVSEVNCQTCNIRRLRMLSHRKWIILQQHAAGYADVTRYLYFFPICSVCLNSYNNFWLFFHLCLVSCRKPSPFPRRQPLPRFFLPNRFPKKQVKIYSFPTTPGPRRP